MIDKQKDLRLRVESATYDECVHSVTSDLGHIMSYYKDRKERDNGRANQVLVYKRRRYNMGLVSISTRMDLQLHIAFHSEFDNASLNVTHFRSKLQSSVQTGPSSTMYSLIILDLTKPPSYQLMENYIRVAAELLHQSPFAALFVQMPVQYAGQDYGALLKHRRRIEDRLMFHKIIIEKDISVTYEVPMTNGRSEGGRPLGSSAKLCWSVEYLKMSNWANSDAARGKIEGVCVQRVRDMRVPMTQGIVVLPDPSKLPPGDRIQQLGERGTTMLLQSLAMNVGIANIDKLVIIDLRPCANAQWLKTCHTLQLEWASGVQTGMGFVAYYGMDFDDACNADAIRVDAQELLLSTWWDGCADAGPHEPSDLTSLCDRPTLSMMSWDPVTKKPVFPPDVSAKFSDSAEFKDVWSALLDKVTEQVGGAAALNDLQMPPASAAPGVSLPVATSIQPDFGQDPPRVSSSCVLVEFEGFDPANVSLGRRPVFMNL